ncbi:MAG: hypothetical protein MZW92_25645 [Comamonadaceae bacterium]|nr:hypothetical protein [Comamonadaceae bacterium]
MAKIHFVQAREILDSRGNPTVEVDVVLDNGVQRPRRRSIGSVNGKQRKLWRLRDGDKKRYLGKGVLKAVANVNTVIAPEIIGMPPSDQKAIDGAL